MATTSEIADELGTDGKTLRKFFRSDATEIEPVGQGSRYEIDDELIPTLRKEFRAWSKGKAKKATDAKAPTDKKSKSKKAAPVVEVVEDEDLELEDIDDEEPTEDELEELEDELTLDDDASDTLKISEAAAAAEEASKPKPRAPRKSRAKKA